MHEQSISEADRTAFLTGAEWDVTEVRALPDFHLDVRFRDGVSGVVDMAAMVKAPNAGLFAVLSDPEMFARAKIEAGAVIWPNVLDAWPWSLDLAPDAMHDELAANGVWVLE